MPHPLLCSQPAKADHAQLYEILVGELTDLVVFLMDPTGCIVSWNPGVERILGYTEGEWLGQLAECIFTPEDRAQGKPQEEMATAARNGRCPDIRWHLRKNGKRFYVDGTMVALHDEKGQLLGFSKIMRDITERKQREEDLQDAPDYAETILGTMREAFLVLDQEGVIRSTNRSFYRTFQLSKEETEDRRLSELSNGGWNIPQLLTLLQGLVPQQGSVDNFEVEHDFPVLGRKVLLINARKLKRGRNHTELTVLAIDDITDRKKAEAKLQQQWHTFDAVLSHIPDHAYTLLTVLAIDDITDRKKAEAKLQQQWHTFDAVLSHIPDHAYTFDLQGRFTYANSPVLTLFQQSQEEMLGKTFFDLPCPPELAGRLQRQIQQVIDTGKPVRDETPFAHLITGETRHYEYTYVPVWAKNRQLEAVAGSSRDTTESARLKQALVVSEERLQQVFAQAPVAIVVFRGPDFVIELANPTYQALLPGRALVGRRFAEVIPELGQPIWDIFRQVLETGAPFVINEQYSPYSQDGDGGMEDHWFNVVYHPLREPDGVVSGMVAVCNEVTTQVLARQGLERVNRELEEFAYVASHDLQEPLRMVNIYTQLILKRLSGKDGVLDMYADFVRQGVTHMERLIHDLLTYSRTVHTESLPVGTADLSVSFREAVTVLKSRIEESSAAIIAPALPTVRGDAKQLAHVFQNLVSNALKYCRKGVPPEIHISAEGNGAQWVVSVRDNGIGFDPQYAERIFGLFKRLHTDEYPGTGLGLAICQRIVERYGGRMWADSSPGKGATFFFALPRGEGC